MVEFGRDSKVHEEGNQATHWSQLNLIKDDKLDIRNTHIVAKNDNLKLSMRHSHISVNNGHKRSSRVSKDLFVPKSARSS